MRGNVQWEQADMENVWVGQPVGATQEGPTVTIFGGVHGDEPSGIQLVKDLRESLALDDGTVYLIEGNPLAVQQGVRYTEANLNRCFRELTLTEKLKEPDELPYELNRAQALLPLLDTSRAALDVHNITLHGPAFIIAEVLDDPETMRVARAIGAEIISPGWSKTDVGGTDGYMFEAGKVGICFESGQKSDVSGSLTRAHAATARFLIANQLVEGDLAPLCNDPKFVVTTEAFIRTADTYALGREFGNFEILTPGEVIVRHGGEEVLAEDNQLIVFPKADPNIGDEAFILAKTINVAA